MGGANSPNSFESVGFAIDNVDVGAVLSSRLFLAVCAVRVHSFWALVVTWCFPAE